MGYVSLKGTGLDDTDHLVLSLGTSLSFLHLLYLTDANSPHSTGG